MKKPHVLFLLSSFNIGGAEIDVLNLSNTLIDKGYRVTIASKGGNLEDKLVSQVRRFHLPIASSNPLHWFLTFLRIFIYSLIHRVTVLNPQSLKGVSLAYGVKKLLGIPLIATIHNLQETQAQHKAVRLLNRVPDVNLFVSEFERQKFIQAGLRPELSKVMYSGINSELFRTPPSTIDRPQTLGIIGRLSSEKGIDIALEAFAKIVKVHPDTKLMIVGDGPEKTKLMELTKQLSLDAHVSFEGARHDIPIILSQIDVLLLPSRKESLSVVAREAMAAGKPVIASDVGGMKELIKQNQNGFFVPSQDINALAEATTELLKQPNQIKELGKRGQNDVKEKFSLINWAQQMDWLYQKACGVRLPTFSKRKNLLYITTRFPFPTIKGDKLRAYYQIKELSKYHNITLLCLLENHDDRQYFSEMEKYCNHIIPIYLSPSHSRLLRRLAHFSWIPSQIAYFYSHELRTLLPKIILSHDIDTVFCQLIRGGQYAAHLSNVWKVIDFVDALSLNLRRNCKEASWFQWPILYTRMLKVKWYEQRLLSVFDQSIIISKSDKNALGDQPMIVAPNGVEQSNVDSSSTENAPLVNDPEIERSIIFTGNMDYWPNEDAVRYLVEEIVPLLDKNLKVYLVGINNNPQVKKYANDQIIITGAVSSIPEHLQKATVAVCPMRLGAGQQNKVLEAMAAGTPVVATTIANAGIQAKDCIQIGDTPEAFARHVSQLLNDSHRRMWIRDKAFQFITQRFDWTQIIRNMEGELWKLKGQQPNLETSLKPNFYRPTDTLAL